MRNNVDLLAVVNYLQSDVLLCELINAAPPQAIVMPFAKDPEKSYLFVAVFFGYDNLRKEAIFTACKRIVALLRHKYLATFDGVEILASVVAGTGTERVLRLSILRGSLDDFEKMNNLELGARATAAGITNLMYKQIT